MKKTRKHITTLLFLPLMIVASSLPIICNNNSTQQFDLTMAKAPESDMHKKRMRKPKNKSEQKRKRNRTYMDMEYEELLVAKDIQVEHNNIPVAIKYLDQLMKLCNDITRMADHLLQMADLFFKNGQFQKSSHIYTQYCSLYPGSEKQEYALYRSIISSFACILSIDRDQTKTEETLALTELFLKQDHFIHYRDDVAQIQMQCCKQLAASECNICNFYLTRNKLHAAEKRLKKIRSYWLPKIPTLEPDIITLEAQLMEQKDMIIALNNPHLRSSFAKASEDTQGSGEQATQVAQNKKTKHMSKRF